MTSNAGSTESINEQKPLDISNRNDSIIHEDSKQPKSRTGPSIFELSTDLEEYVKQFVEKWNKNDDKINRTMNSLEEKLNTIG